MFIKELFKRKKKEVAKEEVIVKEEVVKEVIVNNNKLNNFYSKAKDGVESFLKDKIEKNNTINFNEPITIANIRLTNKVKDYGYKEGYELYNKHKSNIENKWSNSINYINNNTRKQNQWINTQQSVNSGYSNAESSFYNYEIVNYWETATLSQDPIMNKILNLLSQAPFSKGGKIIINNKEYEDKIIDISDFIENKIKLFEILYNALKTSFRDGGCLVYIDFGLKDLTQKLDLNSIHPSLFKGFIKIDPLYCQAIDVNTIDPTLPDFMKPKKWYIVGKGVCDNSHFLKFEQNTPADILRPMCLYFGFPLTNLVKADVANTNLVSQGIANLINRMRYLFLKTNNFNFSNENSDEFYSRLDLLSTLKNNFDFAPINQDEEVQQLTFSTAGLNENLILFYQLLSAKTGIVFTELMGESSKGMNATGEGDRRAWYDKQISIQKSIKENLIKMLNISVNKFIGERFNIVKDYEFNPIEELDEKQESEVLKNKLVCATMFNNMGVDNEQILEWLKSDKKSNLTNFNINKKFLNERKKQQDNNKQDNKKI